MSFASAVLLDGVDGQKSGNFEVHFDSASESPVCRVPFRSALELALDAPAGPLAGARVLVYAVTGGRRILHGLVQFDDSGSAVAGPIARIRGGCDFWDVYIQADTALTTEEARQLACYLTVFAYGTQPAPTEFVDLYAAQRSAERALGAQGPLVAPLPPTFVDYATSETLYTIPRLREHGYLLLGDGGPLRQVQGLNDGPSEIVLVFGDSAEWTPLNAWTGGAGADWITRHAIRVPAGAHFSVDWRETGPNRYSQRDGLAFGGSGSDRYDRQPFVLVSTNLDNPIANIVEANRLFLWAEVWPGGV